MQPATTAVSSPYSNGICKKNHAVVDLMMEKIIEGDPNISENEALDYALNAKNTEPNNKGHSSFQIVYGANPKVPGIINSTPASLEVEFTYSDIKKHLMRLNLARLAFLQADNDERLKRAISSRINSYNEEFFEIGDLVSFKEEDKNKWMGPGKVIGVDGKVLIIKYGNNSRRIHKSIAIKRGKEFQHNENKKNRKVSKTTKINQQQKMKS